MLFNSIQYLIFLPIVIFLYYMIPQKYKWIMLLTASYYFYMCWKPEFIVLILFSTIVCYCCSIGIAKKNASVSTKRLFLVISLVINLGLLFFFKYFNFLTGSIGTLLRSISIPFDPITLKIILPVGISFYTFQALSYTIDVYRGRIEAERHFGYFALYVSYFPQLVAGPIERTSNLLPQLKQEHRFDYDSMTYGLKRMAWGFFKKLVVADTLAIYVNQIYNNMTNSSGFSIIVATFFFAVQIYCDFSGYSDIAIGTAKLMGIQLMQNFNSPYFSKSLKEFWKRWHISLSSWFGEYVYIPLGGNRVKPPRWAFNIFVTFLLSGLWHGARMTFVIWGALHGLYQIIGRLTRNTKTQMLQWLKISPNNRLLHGFQILITFVLVCLAWVFFRANSVSDAIYAFQHAFDGIGGGIEYLKTAYFALSLDEFALASISLSLALLFAYDRIDQKRDVIRLVGGQNLFWRWVIYLLIVQIIIVLMPKGTPTEFIYFQF